MSDPFSLSFCFSRCQPGIFLALLQKKTFTPSPADIDIGARVVLHGALDIVRCTLGTFGRLQARSVANIDGCFFIWKNGKAEVAPSNTFQRPILQNFQRLKFRCFAELLSLDFIAARRMAVMGTLNTESRYRYSIVTSN